MIHYNSNNNAYCRAVNAETFQTIEHNPVWISILLYTRNQYSYSHFEIVIWIYSVRGDIDQMSTNTCSYTICSAPNVYIFVYILIETRVAPLTKECYNWDLFWNHTWQSDQWRALCTEITEVNLSEFVCRLFHEDVSSINVSRWINFCNLHNNKNFNAMLMFIIRKFLSLCLSLMKKYYR